MSRCWTHREVESRHTGGAKRIVLSSDVVNAYSFIVDCTIRRTQKQNMSRERERERVFCGSFGTVSETRVLCAVST